MGLLTPGFTRQFLVVALATVSQSQAAISGGDNTTTLRQYAKFDLIRAGQLRMGERQYTVA